MAAAAAARLAQAAVAGVVRHPTLPQYLLIERARPPKAGTWSLPGGRLEPNERLIAGALREVCEETSLTQQSLLVCPEPVSVTEYLDSEFHYVIVQVLMQLRTEQALALVAARDDARRVAWKSEAEISALQAAGAMGGNVLGVIQRVSAMHRAGLVPLQPADP